MGKLISSSFHSCCSYGDTSVDLFLMHKYHTVSIVVGLLATLHARNVRIYNSYKKAPHYKSLIAISLAYGAATSP